MTDDSKITEVSLFQVGQADALKTFKPAEPSQKFSMPLVESDTDKIDMPGEGNSVSLYVKAKDIHGFESQSNTNSVILTIKVQILTWLVTMKVAITSTIMCLS